MKGLTDRVRRVALNSLVGAMALAGPMGLVACGGSPGGVGANPVAPGTGGPSATVPTGNWIDPNNQTQLWMPSSGPTFGVMQANGVTSLFRGEWRIDGAQLVGSGFTALAVEGETLWRPLSLTGSLAPAGVLTLNMTDPKGPGGPITAVVDTAYDPPPPLSQWAGTYTGRVRSAGLVSDCAVRIDGAGGFTLTNTATPGDFDCGATGRLVDDPAVPALKTMALCWANSPCDLADNPSYVGLARLAPAAPSPGGTRPLLTVVGMDIDGQQGLMIDARP